MSHALFWLPLLGFFFGLAWVGWKEYQKVEAYQTWAQQFEQAKYDIYSVLGQNGSTLTWGLPTSKGPINLETFSLEQVQEIRLWVNGQIADLDTPPRKGKAMLEFVEHAAVPGLEQSAQPIYIPFTEPALAAKWAKYLQKITQKGDRTRA